MQIKHTTWNSSKSGVSRDIAWYHAVSQGHRGVSWGHTRGSSGHIGVVGDTPRTNRGNPGKPGVVGDIAWTHRGDHHVP